VEADCTSQQNVNLQVLKNLVKTRLQRAEIYLWAEKKVRVKYSLGRIYLKKEKLYKCQLD
jgi:hypothetical protein